MKPMLGWLKGRTFFTWIKMGYRYGFWRSKIIKKHPSRHSKREFLPWFGIILTLSLLMTSTPYWFIPSVIYLLVILVEGLRFSIKWRKISLLVGVPLSLITLHTTFSIGLIGGLFRKGRASNDR